MSDVERRSVARLVNLLGVEDAKTFLELDHKLRSIMNADIGPAMERWQDEADRLVYECKSPKKPGASWSFATALIGQAATLIIYNNTGSKEGFLEVCDAVWDMAEGGLEKMKRPN